MNSLHDPIANCLRKIVRFLHPESSQVNIPHCYKRLSDLAASLQQLPVFNYTMQFSKPTLVFAMLVTCASASVLPRDGDTACAGLLDFCASGIHLECCEGFTCLLPGVVSVQLLVIESKTYAHSWQCIPIV